MGNLCLTRRPGERVMVFAPGANPVTDKPLLTIEVVDVTKTENVKLALAADTQYAILREEVVRAQRAFA